MKTLATLLCCGGVVAAAFVVIPPADYETAVVTLGPLESPLLTPRIRVANERSDTVHVGYRVDGAPGTYQLGSVAADATRTFAVPEGVGTIWIVTEPREGGERFVTGGIGVDLETDIGLAVAKTIARSRVEVAALRVVRTRGRR